MAPESLRSLLALAASNVRFVQCVLAGSETKSRLRGHRRRKEVEARLGEVEALIGVLRQLLGQQD